MLDEVFGPVLIIVYWGGGRSQWIRRGLVWRAEQETIEGWSSWCSTQETIGWTSWWFNSIVFSFFSFCHSFLLLVFKYRCLFLELILFWSFLSSSFFITGFNSLISPFSQYSVFFFPHSYCFYITLFLHYPYCTHILHELCKFSRMLLPLPMDLD
jgi:hypothetical protein